MSKSIFSVPVSVCLCFCVALTVCPPPPPSPLYVSGRLSVCLSLCLSVCLTLSQVRKKTNHYRDKSDRFSPKQQASSGSAGDGNILSLLWFLANNYGLNLRRPTQNLQVRCMVGVYEFRILWRNRCTWVDGGLHTDK